MMRQMLKRCAKKYFRWPALVFVFIVYLGMLFVMICILPFILDRKDYVR